MSNDEHTLAIKGPGLKLRVLRGDIEQKEFFFTGPFSIGRGESCRVRLGDRCVSRIHVEGYLRDGHWWIRDTGSANGTYVGGNKIDRLPLAKPVTIELGIDGPILRLEPGGEQPTLVTVLDDVTSVTRCQERYFGPGGPEEISPHTKTIRLAFQRVQRKQKGLYYRIIASVAVLLILALGYAYLQHKKVAKQTQMAVDLFYWMKNLELRIAKLESDLAAAGVKQDLEAIKKEKDAAALKYAEFIEKLGVYDEHMSAEEKLIIRMARVFGECELRLPQGFVAEVQKYVARWKSSDRLGKAVRRAAEQGYALEISNEFLKRGLPDQFFYLAVQESDLDPRRCGPATRFGYAKGMWQFIPETALFYGLKTGPLIEERVYDRSDDRHDFRKSTEAASRYIRDLYNHDAQASGLLVMASYNWGESRVRGFIKSMPEDPRKRNFWLFLEQFANRIPEETYDYIFNIFSAAVIGENPRLFGFDFENPLGHASELEDKPI